MRTLNLVAAITVALALGGCANTPNLDAKFGDSVRLARAQQTLNQQAGRVPRPVNGMDGPSASAAYQNYQQSFTTKDSQSDAFTIGVGSKR